MKWLLPLCAMLAALSAVAGPLPADEMILGKWQFYKIIYRGEDSPPFNPDLILTFEFYGDGTDRLHWERNGEKGFCDRKGTYTIEDGILVDKITWLNPDNNFDCGKDPDMQMGKVSETPFVFKNGDFQLILEMSGEPFIYVWKRVSAVVPTP